ncbi:hypothetical protein ACWKW6_27215 [Dyadobacter jiangsuensis]
MTNINYHILKCNGDPEVTGIRGGSNQSWFTDEFWERNPKIQNFMFGSDRELLHRGLVPDFDVELKRMFLDPKAKHTDCIWTGALLNGFIVSTRLKHLLEKFNLPSHQYYPVTFEQYSVKTKAVIEVGGYWWLYLLKETGEHTVNFSKCSFDWDYHARCSGLPKNVIPINSYQDYINAFLNCPPSLVPTKLVFNENFDRGLDLWSARFLGVQTYVSDRLWQAILSEGITGLEIRTIEQETRIWKITRVPYTKLVFNEN